MRKIYLTGVILSFAASIGCGNLPPFPASSIKETVVESCDKLVRSPTDTVYICTVKFAEYPIVRQNPLLVGPGYDTAPSGTFGFTPKETSDIMNWIREAQSSRKKR